jgi:xanthine dehydrogenase YagS FAD-binding subunit
MKAFEYASPASVEDAVKALAGADSSAALSGGTDLLSRMKDYVTSPGRVVYLKEIKALAGIEAADGGGLTIGAGTRLVDVVQSREIAEKYPALRQATLEVGTPQIRNMATVGGNLLQRPRDWYYRAGYGLLGGKTEGKSLVRELEGEFAPVDIVAQGRQGDVHLVREGDNRYHAIFLTDGDALFISPSSLAIPLVALGAKATLVGPKGERTVAVEDLYQVPKKEGDRELTVAAGELLTKVTIPAPKGKNASYEARQKRAHDWPLVLCSVADALAGDRVENARVVLYGVAPIPWRSQAAEKAITGKAITPETAAAAGDAAVEGAKPLSQNAYKVPLTRAVVKRALLAAVGNRYWEEA